MAYRLEVLNSIAPSTWNSWVSQASSGTIYHTTFWAERLCELWDCKPYFICLYQHDSVVPSLLLLGFDVRSDLIMDKPSVLSRLRTYGWSGLRANKRRFQWFGIPVGAKDIGGDAYRLLALEIERFCRKEGIPTISSSPFPKAAEGFLPDGWKSNNWATLVVNLQQPEDALWRNLKKPAKKAIKSARERGVSVRRIDSLQDLRKYYDFACECATRYGKKMYGFIDMETMWRHFRSNAIYETFVAEKDNELLDGLGIWGFGGMISEHGAFQSERGFKEKLYGGDLIKWEVLQWGSRKGYRMYDLAGVSPNPQTGKERGIRQFKEKWGGEYQLYLQVSWRNNM